MRIAVLDDDPTQLSYLVHALTRQLEIGEEVNIVALLELQTWSRRPLAMSVASIGDAEIQELRLAFGRPEHEAALMPDMLYAVRLVVSDRTRSTCDSIFSESDEISKRL